MQSKECARLKTWRKTWKTTKWLSKLPISFFLKVIRRRKTWRGVFYSPMESPRFTVWFLQRFTMTSLVISLVGKLKSTFYKGCTVERDPKVRHLGHQCFCTIRLSRQRKIVSFPFPYIKIWFMGSFPANFSLTPKVSQITNHLSNSSFFRVMVLKTIPEIYGKNLTKQIGSANDYAANKE